MKEKDVPSSPYYQFFKEVLPMMSFRENTPLYQIHEMQHALLAPFNFMAETSKQFHRNPLMPHAYTGFGRSIAAAFEVMERVTNRYPKPHFNITKTEMKGKTVEVVEKVARETPFCKLLHFEKKGKVGEQPTMLVVAPMSGHHATLLRGTVQGLLPHADVYITDWQDARDIPLAQGPFGLDGYIKHLLDFMKFLGPKVHVMAVCQPAVPVFAAVSLLSMENPKKAPRSMTLIGGPIDTREAPTQVNTFAQNHSISWFESHVITRVPFNYPGFMRRVYPGFLQLTGFMSMNWGRHVGEHMKLFQHLVEGDGESADAHRKFYNEYLAVADICADFYLETMDKVFHRHALPEGEFDYRGEIIDPSAITQTALLTIEGALDDISGVGQTKAAHRLVTRLPKNKQHYHLQKNVGHYGIFNGRRYKEHVVPVIVDWMKQHG